MLLIPVLAVVFFTLARIPKHRTSCRINVVSMYRRTADESVLCPPLSLTKSIAEEINKLTSGPYLVCGRCMDGRLRRAAVCH